MKIVVNVIKFIDKAITIIEKSKEYAVLSKDLHAQPIYVGNRTKLAKVLEGVKNDMVIATAGDDKKCIVLMDYSNKMLEEMVKRVDIKRIAN